MKKTTITISFDEEKLAAIRLYMGQKDVALEEEIRKAIDGFYTKYVPASVREFLELREKPGREAKEKKPQGGNPPGTGALPEKGAGGA